MTPSDTFDDLLFAAAGQPQPQRLLFVFASAEMPDHPTPEQAAAFHAGRGGALAPRMCVDKAPDELTGFDALVAESRRAGPPWQVVFAAALSGEQGRPPAKAQIDTGLEKMVNAIALGSVGQFAAFAADGAPLQFR
jgi:hypothetical protein